MKIPITHAITSVSVLVVNAPLASVTFTTTEYVPPTTAYVPPTTAYTPSPADRAYAMFITEIPVLARNTRADVEDMLGTVCDVIDESDGDFSVAGSVVVASSVGSFDFTYANAGTILGAAVVIRCPQWASAASAFANGSS